MRNSQMETYRDYVTMLLKGHVHSVLCHSKAGFGKTYTTIKILKEFNVKYSYSSGVATAVSLFKLLYENKNNLLILDDIETIFQDDRIINILKSALWEVDGKRMVSYKTSAKVLEDYPDDFEYKGKLIILANELRGKKDESYKALLSRCLKYELSYTLSELIKIGKNIIEEREDITSEQKCRIITIMESNISVQHSFNFRLLMRLVAFVKYDFYKAEKLFLDSLDIDEEAEIMVDIIKNNNKIKNQIIEFRNRTGQSRMTFFRKKKKLKDEGII